jgi:pyruvate-formate lyase-activating enzyme
MKCVMTWGLYLRADGTLPCYCSMGENVTLGKLLPGDQSGSFTEETFLRGQFAHIRDCMKRDVTPFPGICEQCIYFEPEEPFPEEEDSKVVEWFQWEPSFGCQLDCEWCGGGMRDTWRTEKRSQTLDFETFRSVVGDLADKGFTLGMGNVCGYGEPTLNRDVWKQIRYAKDRMGGDILLSTNGNTPFSEEIVPSGLDKIKIAIDGTTQEVYAHYRKRGNLDRLLKYSHQIADHKQRRGSASPRIIWQYIVFDHNDSDEELIRLQEMAIEHGVDAVRVNHTCHDHFSERPERDVPALMDDIIFSWVKTESVFPLEEARKAWSDVSRLWRQGDAAALGQTFLLVRRLNMRFQLGITHYTQYLRFAEGVPAMYRAGLVRMTPDEFHGFSEVLADCYRHLEGHFRERRETAQAEAYAGFARDLAAA